MLKDNMAMFEDNMAEDAAAYDELSQPQYKAGCKFINDLNIFRGQAAKVLDMGCGTGDVTKYIVDIIGPDGEVVGIDPDDARIKIALEKFKDVGNLKFHVGDSATGFPHEKEPYYDVHINTYAFHFFPDEHKKLYLEKAHRSLKSGGKLAIMCSDKKGPASAHSHGNDDVHYLSEDEYRKLFQDIALFTDVVVEPVKYTAHLKSYEVFKRWVKASIHRSLDEYDPAFVKKFVADCATCHEDGSIDFIVPSLSITASRE